MAPSTRSQKAPQAGPSRIQKDPDSENEPEGDTTHSDIENHLSHVRRTFKKLRNQVVELRRQNEGLTAELAEAKEEANVQTQPKRGKKAGPTAASLQKEVSYLKSKLEKLEKSRKKDKKKIQQLQLKEAKKDAAELNAEADEEVGDTAYAMRKLLREFSDLVAINSLEGTEECPICMEKLEIDSTVSFPCQHIICDSCFKQLAPNADTVKCPECRTECARDEVEVVRHTAVSQWDALLKVASRFSKMDKRRVEDTSEEEAEEEFVDDEETEETKSVVSAQASTNPLLSSPEAEDADYVPTVQSNQEVAVRRKKRAIATPDTTPERDPDANAPSGSSELSEPPDGSPGPSTLASRSQLQRSESQTFAQSPFSDKKKRLKELAEARKSKRPRL